MKNSIFALEKFNMRCETLIIIFYLYKKNKTLELNRGIEIPMFFLCNKLITFHYLNLSAISDSTDLQPALLSSHH